ncbi:MAG: UDP-N-acetylmuramoyl-L-alanine--D-glutamate ligase [Candidatus Omnitrophica bacterium]|nr:UDP-N-acetylmuramoyl-L-alanine--D-glutamate ligase [Candidatus Omnitrophota bacterium]
MNRNIKNKKIVIVGLSRSGYAAAILALKQKAIVYVSENSDNKTLREKAKILIKKNAFVELGGHNSEFFKDADFFITSPGVKNNALPIVWAKQNKIKIYSEIEFASWFCPAPIIAITGSNGKTTVTTLLGKVLKQAGKKVVVCGNIGNPFSGEFLKFKKADFIVLEVSSFQLEYIQWLKPKLSIILNITQNHFDHHHDMADYAQAKARILLNQDKTDYTVLNAQDNLLRKIAKKTNAKVLFFSRNKKIPQLADQDINCYLDKEKFIIRIGKNSKFAFALNDLKIKGEHNQENVMAVSLAAKALGINNQAIAAVLSRFKGLEHRCEKVASIKGICFVNDSKSTTVDATDKALSVFLDKSVILICGGRDKGSNFSVLEKKIKQKVFCVIAIGEAKPILISAFSPYTQVITADSLKQAVQIAFKQAKSGQSVLLSPMCASFDMFDNFEHRGQVFKQIVQGMIKK